MDKSIDLLKGAVSIYSTSTKEKQTAEFLVNEMKVLGFNSFVDGAGNAVGEIGTGQKTILMVGHIDTVPGEIKVKIDGSKLYGRGSVDAKGPFCSFVMAASKADLTGKKIVVVGAVEEECATSKGARFLIGKYKPDFIIVGEPSGYDAITLGYKGRLLLEYTLERDISHTASRNLGVIEDAVNFYSSLRESVYAFNKNKQGIFEKVQICIRDINSSDDGFREKVKMFIGYRLPVGYDTAALKKFVEQIKGDAKVEFYGEEAPIEAGKNNDLVKSFLKSMREHKIEPRFKLKTGTSDMNVLAHSYPNVPIVTYGPGDASLDHTPNEHIDLEEYKKAIDILANVLERL